MWAVAFIMRIVHYKVWTKLNCKWLVSVFNKNLVLISIILHQIFAIVAININVQIW